MKCLCVKLFTVARAFSNNWVLSVQPENGPIEYVCHVSLDLELNLNLTLHLNVHRQLSLKKP